MTRPWRFVKMHGAGNDFVVLDCIGQSIELTPSLARRIADRHRGIGCDQILLVEAAPDPSVDFRYRIFNADGGEVEQCGNGARCFVRFVHEQGLSTKRTLRIATLGGIIEPHLTTTGEVSVDMGVPRLDPAHVPFDPGGLDRRSQAAGFAGWPIEIDGGIALVHVLSMGNPHAVQFVDDVDRAPVATVGPRIEQHRRFPRRVNAGFAQVEDRHHLRLRVYERGAGETLSCGTGACAAVVSGILLDRLTSPVAVQTMGGTLTIAWGGVGTPVIMSGPAQSVFSGTFDPTALQP